MPTVDHALEIAAEPAAIVAAFFRPEALACWWHATRSVTTPRVLGVYAVEWPPTPFEDEVFGPLGGVLHGMIVDYRADREFLVAEVHWLPPASEPIGPMALHVSCSPAGTPPLSSRAAPATRVRVLQTGGDESQRWKRYFQIMAAGWTSSLAALKTYLESPPGRPPTKARPLST